MEDSYSDEILLFPGMRGGEDEQCQGKGIQKGMKLFVSINNTGKHYESRNRKRTRCFKSKSQRLENP